MPARKTLLLTKKEIQKILPLENYLTLVEGAFRDYGRGHAIQPPKLYLLLPRQIGDFRAMPAFFTSPKRCGMKWVNVHPGNRRRKLPAVMALIILNELETGFPLAILDGTYITKMRTGAGGAIAAKFLARKNARVLGLVGCGVQAETQLLFLSKLFHFKKINFWGLTPKNRKHFLQKFNGKALPLEEKKTIRDAVLGADILVTATPSRRPLVREGWVKPGCHINAIGADAKGKEELDVALLKRGKLVIDDWHQASQCGEMNVPFSKGKMTKKDVYATLGEIVCGVKKGRENHDEITIFDSTGLAVQDVAVAWEIYRRARDKGVGKKICFF